MTNVQEFPNSDQVYRFYSTDLSIRAVVSVTTNASRIICQQLQTTPTATVGLSRALTGAALLAANLGENQHIGLHFNGDGPIAGIFAEASNHGHVRAWCGDPQVDITLSQSGDYNQIHIPTALGTGVLTVTRSVPFEKQPRVSTVPLISGEIGQDIALYLDQSSQIPSIVSLGILLGADGLPKYCVGALIEVMPGASDDIISLLETNAENAPTLSDVITSAAHPREIVEVYTNKFNLIQSDQTTPLTFKCKCSQERLERSITMLGSIEMEELIKDGKTLEAKCEFCGHSYSIRHERLMSLLREMTSKDPTSYN